MRRRNFLQGLAPVGAALLAAPQVLAHPLGKEPTRAATDPARLSGYQPPFLQPGDFIGITCPASGIEQKDARYSEVMFAKWGLRTKIGNTVGKNWNRFAGTDKERAADMQRMLEDPSLKALVFARGGYGTMRMMDMVDWKVLQKNPKWLVGYSDITAIHCHLNSLLKLPSIHGRMAGGFGAAEDVSEQSLKNVLMGQPIDYRWRSNHLNRPGSVYAPVVGGNLSLIYAMQASVSELDTTDKILFIEDVNEYKYTVDRMLMNLKRSGKFDQLKGLIVGGFTGTKTDADGYFTMSLQEIIFEKVKEYDFPVCFDFPAGHQRPNMALKLGIPYHLDVEEDSCSLQEVRRNLFAPPPPLMDSITVPEKGLFEGTFP